MFRYSAGVGDGQQDAGAADAQVADPLVVVHAEAVRELNENLTVQGNYHTRALVLIGAAAFSLGLLRAPEDVGSVWAIGTFLAIVSAGFGVAAMWSRKEPLMLIKEKELPGLLDEGRSHDDVLRDVTNGVVKLEERRHKNLVARARLINRGFALLVAAWLLIATGMIFDV